MYTINLTDQDVDTIAFVGYRYSWSDALYKIIQLDEQDKPLPIVLKEHEAWALREQFEADTEGGHSMFPMLDPNSELSRKLYKFYESII